MKVKFSRKLFQKFEKSIQPGISQRIINTYTAHYRRVSFLGEFTLNFSPGQIYSAREVIYKYYAPQSWSYARVYVLF